MDKRCDDPTVRPANSNEAPALRSQDPAFARFLVDLVASATGRPTAVVVELGTGQRIETTSTDLDLGERGVSRAIGLAEHPPAVVTGIRTLTDAVDPRRAWRVAIDGIGADPDRFVAVAVRHGAGETQAAGDEERFDAVAGNALRLARRHYQDVAGRSVLSRAQTLLSNVETFAAVGLWQVSLPDRRLSWSDEVFRIHGLEPGPAPTLEEAIAFYPPDVRPAVRENFERAIAEQRGFSHTLPIHAADGCVRVVRCVATVEADQSGAQVLGILQDVTVEKETERRLWWTANHDPLTDLPNRMLFQSRLAESIERAKGDHTLVGLVVLDIDNFKTVNDVYGHDAGDLLLVRVAELLRGNVRASDTVARLGGDEFAIILSDLVERADLVAPVERLQEALTFAFPYGNVSIPVRVSMGAALFPVDAGEGSNLYRHADIALYRTKRYPQRRVTYYEPAFTHELRNRDELMRKLRDGLDQGEIEIGFQAQIDLADDAIAGLEVLARWRHGGQILPAKAFLAALESYDLAPRIGLTVLEQLSKAYAGMRAMGVIPPTIFLNVSRQELENVAYLEALEAFVKRPEVIRGTIALEMHEDIRERLTPHVRTTLDALEEDEGLLFAFDTFAGGLSALADHPRFPIRQIKIEHAFTRDIHLDGKKRALLGGIVSTCAAIDVDLVANGIETEAQLAVVRESGFRYAQGYLLAQPASFVNVMRALTRDGARRDGGVPAEVTTAVRA